MKKTVCILFLLISLHTLAQSKIILEVFKLLPPEKIYDLTTATRDSMLAGKTYYPADNDSNSILAYNYGISTFVDDYMYVSMSFETRQRATGMIEIRNFKTVKGENLILVSETGGVYGVNYYQQNLSAFIYNNKKLTPYSKALFPTAEETLFMKRGIPDSVKQVILNNSNLNFNFSLEKPVLKLDSDYISRNEATRKWLKGDYIEFAWTGDRFVIKKTGFEYEAPKD